MWHHAPSAWSSKGSFRGDCSECRIGATNLCTTYNEIGFTRPGADALRSDVTDDELRGKVVIALT